VVVYGVARRDEHQANVICPLSLVFCTGNWIVRPSDLDKCGIRLIVSLYD